jgi:hypothetical protein
MSDRHPWWEEGKIEDAYCPNCVKALEQENAREATGYMKGPNDPPLKPCTHCGAEINANWTIRALQAQLEAVTTVLDEIESGVCLNANYYVTKKIRAAIQELK